MIYQNNQENIKIRIGNLNTCLWKTIKKGEIIDLEQELGEKLKFNKIQDIKEIINIKIENKIIDYEKELKSIQGINKKTIKDILEIYPTRNLLINSIKNNENIPIRDDLEIKLREYYGRIDN